MRSRVLRVAVLAMHLGLVVGLPAWLGLARTWVVLPLLLPLPGLWRGRSYTYAWASLLQVFYAGALLVEALGGAPVAIALAVLAAFEFCALLLFVRVRAAELKNAGAGVS